MKELKYYICEHCGNVVEMVKDSGVNPVCCGQKMTHLAPGTVEASHEKHIPVIRREGDRVDVYVGAVAHPMSAEHSIEWVSLVSAGGVRRVYLNPDDAPTVSFAAVEDGPITVYAYCNLHGLWRADAE